MFKHTFLKNLKYFFDRTTGQWGVNNNNSKVIMVVMVVLDVVCTDSVSVWILD